MSIRTPFTQTSFDSATSVGPRLFEGFLAPIEALLVPAADPWTSSARRLRLLGAVGRRVDALFELRAAAFRATGAGTLPTIRRQRLRALLESAHEIWAQQLLPALRERGLPILEWHELRLDERRGLARIFVDELSPLLTPLTVDAAHPFPAVASLSLNVAVWAREPRSGTERYIGIELPPTFPRFLETPGGEGLVPIERVIGANLSVLLPDLDVLHHHAFRVTREVRPRRARGGSNSLVSRTRPVVRLEVDAEMPATQRRFLVEGLGVERGDVDTSPAPLDLSALTALPLTRLLAAESQGAARLRVRERRGGRDDGGR